jgi:hypothetical protein
VRDEDLRTLEREALASNSAEARLRYADALERLGRAADAIEVLWPAIESAAVRERLTGWPSVEAAYFGHYERCRSELARCTQTAPSPSFRVTIGSLLSPAPPAFELSLRATPLGLCVFPHDGDTLVLDPATGRTRARIDSLEPIAVAHDVLICALRRPELVLVGCDLWDARRLWRLKIHEDIDPRYLPRVAVLADLMAVWDGRPGFRPVRVYVHEMSDPRRGPSSAFRVLPREPEQGITWHVDGTADRLNLTLSSPNLFEIVEVHGDTGAILSRTAKPLPPDESEALAASTQDSSLAVQGDDLVATTLDGRERWRRSLADFNDPSVTGDGVVALVPYARSIFGLTASGTLFRLAP